MLAMASVTSHQIGLGSDATAPAAAGSTALAYHDQTKDKPVLSVVLLGHQESGKSTVAVQAWGSGQAGCREI